MAIDSPTNVPAVMCPGGRRGGDRKAHGKASEPGPVIRDAFLMDQVLG